MAGITLEKGKQIYNFGQPMTTLHLITAGKVEVSYPGGTYILNKGDVIGVCEICSEVHFLNYTALENTSILTYPISSLEALENLLQKHPDVARLFLLSLFRQIHMLLEHCSIAEMNCSNLYHNLKEDYEKYNTLCMRYRLPMRTLEGIEDVNAYLNDEQADLWLNSYYVGLAHLYATDNYKCLVEEASVSIGMLHKGSLDFRKTYQSIDEQFRYLQQLSEFYFCESGNDLFDCYTSLYYKLEANSEDAQNVLSVTRRMIGQARDTVGLDSQQQNNRVHSFESNIAKLNTITSTGEENITNAALQSELTNSLNTILDFAGTDWPLAAAFRQHVNTYKNLKDRASLDDTATRLRSALTTQFYELYTRLFERSLEEMSVPMPVWMFLYFGYIDEELAGEDNAVTLYSIAKSLNNSDRFGIYTFYDWLLAIYDGRKEPSRDEFDQDYYDYIHKQKATGKYDNTKRSHESESLDKVNFELRNMFPPANKMTFGRISGYCPLFTSDNVLKNLNDSYVTAAKVCKAIEEIKRVDYTAFYRESIDTEHIDAMGREPIHLEFLPDVILMPNVGIRAAMWQEIEGKRRNSPSRMLISIFHLEDLLLSFIRLTGEFRWELCKRIQGGRWNDISDSSLTSEYFDYVQFYRKNRDLTPEAKERVRNSLQRAKNSFKEMFIHDYIIWVMFEGNGSPRLNKVARKILFTYCPFPANICETLMQNPLYTEILNRHKILTAQKLHHLNNLKQKIRNSRLGIPETLEHEFSYVEGKPLT